VDGVERLTISSTDPEPELLAIAVGVLARGGLVVFPTDTLYGLAVDPRNRDAVARVYEVKRRMPTQALPLIAADLRQVESAAVSLSPETRRLASHFWPGPLTLIVDAMPSILPGVRADDGSAAIRVPGHEVARRLAAAAGFPVVATSANRSGHQPSATADGAAAAVGNEVDLVLDGGTTPGGLASTIVDARAGAPRLLRVGAIAFDRVLEAL
jgi:L-threonylcarbamoyladenylate synthase